MKIKLLLTILLVTCSLFGQAQIAFQKMYRNISEFNSLGTMGATVLQTLDSGFLIIGLEYDTLNAGSTDIYLIKTNRFGDTLWTKIYGTTSFDAAYTVIQTTDGGFAFSGVSENNSILIRTNSIGDTLWTKQYISAFYFSIANTLQQTSDGGFILAGSASVPYGIEDLLLIKTDATGNVQWSKLLGGSGLERAFSVFEVTGSGYILSGLTGSFSLASDDVYVVRTDLNGNLLWSKIYGGSKNDIARCMQKTNDGGYIIAGESDSFNGNNLDIYVIKINSTGNLTWSKVYNVSTFDYGFYISQTNDNGYIISGGINAGGGEYSPYLLKINSTGNVLWSKTIDANYMAYCAIQTNDDGFAILTTRNDSISWGLSLIKTDSIGNACTQNSVQTNIINHTTASSIPATSSNAASFTLSPMNLIINSRGYINEICPSSSINEPAHNDYQLEFFPNPFSIEAILYSDKIFRDAILTIYNSSGQEVKQIKNISGYSITLLRDNLPGGIFFIRLTEDNKIITTGKLIITD